MRKTVSLLLVIAMVTTVGAGMAAADSSDADAVAADGPEIGPEKCIPSYATAADDGSSPISPDGCVNDGPYPINPAP